ncbi:PREDICTED: complement decay-accelerating factor-like [Thamnophis sirtalis]|uniref:Complement decay-accelerating factor-like n=1 Tax=Thamnophis sirtalis TaxID=35019 RepID=A0A6I9YTZ5_9SAUR|nr:PREDICTED: complement decay-accelerating factor-like [Thamnophis sirtalis]
MDLFVSCSDEVLWPALILLLFSSTALCECPIPVLPPHSSLKEGELADAYAVGTVLQLQCIPGYVNISGTIPTMICLDTNKWSDLLTLCQGVCPTPILPPHSSLKEGQELADAYRIGTVLQLHCIPGYTPIPGTIRSMTCLDINRWSDLPKACQRRNCPTPHIENGNIESGDGFLLGDQITLSCNHGYRMRGSSTVRCVLRFGKVDWDRGLPHCKSIPCAIPPVIANGIYNPSPSDEYYVGLTVTYLCDRDYSLIGDSTIQCEVAENGVDGIWNMLAPECKIGIFCSNGFLLCSPTTRNQEHQRICDDIWVGEWSPPPPPLPVRPNWGEPAEYYLFLWLHVMALFCKHHLLF